MGIGPCAYFFHAKNVYTQKKHSPGGVFPVRKLRILLEKIRSPAFFYPPADLL